MRCVSKKTYKRRKRKDLRPLLCIGHSNGSLFVFYKNDPTIMSFDSLTCSFLVFNIAKQMEAEGKSQALVRIKVLTKSVSLEV